METYKLFLLSAISIIVFASCKSEEEKRNDKIISELSDLDSRLGGGVIDYQKITVYSADSLDYWAIPHVQEILSMYMVLHDEYECYKAEARKCGDPELVLKAASYGLGGDRYNSQRNAEEDANRCFQDMEAMKPGIINILNSSSPLPKEGVWVVEEYKYNKYDRTYTDYSLYHFSDSGELLSNGVNITSPNPFQIINSFIGNKYTSEDIYFQRSE